MKKTFYPINISIAQPEDGFKNNFDLKVATKGWKTIEVRSDSELNNIVTTYPYGLFEYTEEDKLKTIIDKDGNTKKESQRQGKHVLRINSSMIIMDIDSDITLDETIQRMDEKFLKYAIVTTKRHQKEGHGDRFRLMLPVDLRIGNSIDVQASQFQGSIQTQEKIRKKRISDYYDALSIVSEDLFPIEVEETRDDIDNNTGEIIKITEMKIGTLVDKGPFSLGGKFHPSPKDAIFISKLNDPTRKTFTLNDVLLRKLIERINQQNETAKKRAITLKLSQLKNKDVGTYKWFKEINGGKNIVNIDLLKSIDLAELITYYEYNDNVIPEVTQLSNGGTLVHIHGENGAKYHINTSSEGLFYYYDYNQEGERGGSIIDYMHKRFPKTYDTLSPFPIALQILKDFPDEKYGLKDKLILKNPAFYLEDYLSCVASEGNLERFLKEKDIKSIDFTDDYSRMIITQNNDWKDFFSLEESIINEIKKISDEEKNIILSTSITP